MHVNKRIALTQFFLVLCCSAFVIHKVYGSHSLSTIALLATPTLISIISLVWFYLSGNQVEDESELNSLAFFLIVSRVALLQYSFLLMDSFFFKTLAPWDDVTGGTMIATLFLVTTILLIKKKHHNASLNKLLTNN